MGREDLRHERVLRSSLLSSGVPGAPAGEPFPAKVVTMIMAPWTPDGSWVEKDGSILYVHERRPRGRGFTVERYPLIVVEQHRDHVNEVLYGVEALEYFKRNGIEQVKVHLISDADGFPPRGQRHPAT